MGEGIAALTKGFVGLLFVGRIFHFIHGLPISFLCFGGSFFRAHESREQGNERGKACVGCKKYGAAHLLKTVGQMILSLNFKPMAERDILIGKVTSVRLRQETV